MEGLLISHSFKRQHIVLVWDTSIRLAADKENQRYNKENQRYNLDKLIPGSNALCCSWMNQFDSSMVFETLHLQVQVEAP